MKAILIVYNQALTEKVDFILDKLNVRGFTKWENVLGRGSVNGEPRMSTHTWPEQNSSTLTVVENEKVSEILDAVKKLNSMNEEIGIRAFVWEIEMCV